MRKRFRENNAQRGTSDNGGSAGDADAEAATTADAIEQHGLLAGVELLVIATKAAQNLPGVEALLFHGCEADDGLFKLKCADRSAGSLAHSRASTARRHAG